MPIGPGDIVLDGDPVPPPHRKGHSSSPPVFGPCLLWPNSHPSQQLMSSCKLEMKQLNDRKHLLPNRVFLMALFISYLVSKESKRFK